MDYEGWIRLFIKVNIGIICWKKKEYSVICVLSICRREVSKIWKLIEDIEVKI